MSERRDAIVRVLRDAIRNRANAREDKDNLFVKLAGTEVLFVPGAIPAALTVGPAKEMVGQPFLNDHLLTGVLSGKRAGPVHVIGCHKGVTEAQATRLLGLPDAEFVSAPFGVCVPDSVQKVQPAFLKDCCNETTARHDIQRFFEWLEQTEEVGHLAERAASRAKIIRAIAAEAPRKS